MDSDHNGNVRIVRFTEQEIAITRQMLDVALKTLGGQAAQAYLLLDGKLKNASIEEPKST